MKTSLLLWCLAVLFCMPILLNAQEKKEGKTLKFILNVDEVKPSKYFEYVDAVKGVVEFLKKNQHPYPVYIFSDEDFNFYFNTPIGASFASLDTLAGSWKSHYKSDKEGLETAFKAFDDSYYNSKEFIMTWVEDLSYSPTLDYRSAVDYPFTEVMTWYILPGKMKEAKSLMKRWVQLYKDQGIQLGFTCYIGGFGTDKPVMWIISRFKDRTEAGAMTDVANKKLEEIEGMKELWAETINITRKIDNTVGWYRAKLSYIPKK